MYRKMKRIVLLTLVASLWLGLAGCTESGASAQAGATPPVASAAAPAGGADVAVGALFGGDPAQTVAQVDSIQSYRMHVEVINDGQPSAIIEVAHVKEPLAEDDLVTFYQQGTPTTANVRFVNDTLFLNNGDKWTVISTFNLAELTIITPSGMAAAAPKLRVVGREELSGRTTLHLQGGKEAIPDIQTATGAVSVQAAEAAQLDLWVDVEERFVVKVLFSLTVEGKTFTTEFLYYDFNAPIVVEAPTNVAPVAAPPTPLPAEIVALLGFNFPVPDGAQMSVLAGTTNILMPVDIADARRHLEDAMAADGFAQVGSPEERGRDEFVYTFQRDARTVTASVFSTVSGKSTIQFKTAR